MRAPDLDLDGWRLESGLERHAQAPETFEIPPEYVRTGLDIGDLAKLIFEIAIDNDDEPWSIERMWVIVREVTPEGQYFGLLDNKPFALAENDEFWLGTEIPFGPEHIIDAEPASSESIALAAKPPLRSWPRA